MLLVFVSIEGLIVGIEVGVDVVFSGTVVGGDCVVDRFEFLVVVAIAVLVFVVDVAVVRTDGSLVGVLKDKLAGCVLSLSLG